MNKSEIEWTMPDGLLDENKRLTQEGKFTITGKWHGFEASAKLVVTKE